MKLLKTNIILLTSFCFCVLNFSAAFANDSIKNGKLSYSENPLAGGKWKIEQQRNPVCGMEDGEGNCQNYVCGIEVLNPQFEIQNPKLLNLPDKPTIPAGIEQTKDIAALYFKFYETYLKAADDGDVNFADVQYLVGPAMLLIPAFSGATQIINEIINLDDNELKLLLLLADEYELGKNAQAAKQVFKTILTLAQTYLVLNRG